MRARSVRLGIGGGARRVKRVDPPEEPGEPTLIGMQFCNLSAAEETAIIELIAHFRLGTKVPLSPSAPESD